jgi:hypothetical protein
MHEEKCIKQGNKYILFSVSFVFQRNKQMWSDSIMGSFSLNNGFRYQQVHILTQTDTKQNT